MTAARYARSKWRTIVRSVSSVAAVFFGFAALLFTTTPKAWDSSSQHSKLLGSFLNPDIAHADVPSAGDSGGDSGGDCGGDSGCGDSGGDGGCGG